MIVGHRPWPRSCGKLQAAVPRVGSAMTPTMVLRSPKTLQSTAKDKSRLCSMTSRMPFQ